MTPEPSPGTERPGLIDTRSEKWREFVAATPEEGLMMECPTPQYHRTHRYCPSCPWTEADDAPPCRAVLEHATNPSLRYRCDSYEGHAGPHQQDRPDIGTNVKMEWPNVP